jgi:hypothetical protein
MKKLRKILLAAALPCLVGCAAQIAIPEPGLAHPAHPDAAQAPSTARSSLMQAEPIEQDGPEAQERESGHGHHHH